MADAAIGNYWFKFHGMIAGSGNHVHGVIHYEGAEDVDPTTDQMIDAEGVVSY